MRRIITFLGDRGAVPTTYIFEGREYAGGVFAEALRQFCPYDEMLVCVTEKAREKTWPVLQALDDDRIKALDIPTGRNTAEMWETFRVITENVNSGDVVTFDITHGLRSLPFLAFLFAAYLKAAKDVVIGAIYYGALELGDSRNGVAAPVIDLSEFAAMLDWITATDQFIHTGVGDALSDLLNGQRPPGAAMRDDPAQRVVGRQLKAVATVIDQTSLALSLARPLEAMRAASMLNNALDVAGPALAARARPFMVLTDKVRSAYAPFALGDPLDESNLQQNLLIQCSMVAWYVDKRQYVQAATLAREVVISMVAFRLGLNKLLDKTDRESVETAINNLTESRKSVPRTPINTSVHDAAVGQFPEAETLVKLWSRLSDLRNDIAHVGMRTSPRAAHDLAQAIEGLPGEIRDLAAVLLAAKQTTSDDSLA